MKRALSLVLVLVMLVGLVPMQAFATTEKAANGLSLEGLNVLCLGDSITAGQGLTTDTRWTNVLASKYNWTLTNKSQGGISLSSYYYTANGQTDVSIAKKAEVLKTMTTKPDVIIVWGGHNDVSYRGAPLGSWKDDTTDSFKGALKYIAELAEEYAPDATLFVLTPIWNSEKASALKVSENATDNNWMFIDAIYEGAEKYGWIPINMDLCGITPYKKSEVFLDGIHPNAVGTEMIVEFLSEELANYGANSKKETVILNQSTISLEVGKKTTVKAVLTPRSGYNTPAFAWSSSNTDVATVSSNGVITAVAHGNATITATADNGVSATVKVSVAEGEHTYTPTVTAPTCTEQGYTTHSCTCGDSYVDDYVDASGHQLDSIVCTVCGKMYPDTVTDLDSALAITVTPENYLTISNPFTEELACGPNLVTYGNGKFAVAYLADDVNTVETESSTTIVCRLGLFDVNTPENGTFFDIATAGQTIGNVTIGSKAPYEPNLLKLSDDALLVLFNIRDTAGNYVYYSATFDIATNTVTSYQPLTLDGKNWTPANIAASYNTLAENDISTSGPASSMVFTSRIIQHEGYYYGYCGGICSGFGGMLVRSTDGVNWTSVMAPEALFEMKGVIECGFEFLEDYVYFCMRDISSGVYHCSYDFKTGEQLTKTSKLSGITTSKPTAFTQNGNLYLIVNKATGDDNTVGRRNTALFYQVNPESCRLALVRQVFCADGIAYHSVVNYNGINYWSFHTDARRISPYTQGRSNLAFLQIPELYAAESDSADGVLNLNDYSYMFGRGCITGASNTWQAGAVNMHYQIPLADFVDFDTVTITANNEQKAYIAFFTKRMTQNGAIAYADGWTEQLIMEPGTVQTLTIPEDAAYLYILNNNAAGANLLPESVVFSTNTHTGPVITQQPESVEQEIDKKFAITVKAEGDGLTYQWYYKESYQKNFSVSSNKTASYAYTMQSYMNGRQVYCVITDANGDQVTTETATISRPPVAVNIIEQPQDAHSNVGEKFSISPKVEGEGLTYQWYVKEAGAKAFKISSNKTSAYAYTMQNYMIGRQVYCVITDKYGNSVTTDVATISLPVKELKILTQPTDVYASLGEKFSIAPEVEGEGLIYQWYYKNAGGKSFAVSSNKTSAYAYSMQSYMNGRSVYCVITDQFGNTIQTGVATIHVK